MSTEFQSLIVLLVTFSACAGENAFEVGSLPGVHRNYRLSVCRTRCLDKFLPRDAVSDEFTKMCHMISDCWMCWDQCQLLEDSFMQWHRICEDRVACFPGCQAACTYHVVENHRDEEIPTNPIPAIPDLHTAHHMLTWSPVPNKSSHQVYTVYVYDGTWTYLNQTANFGCLIPPSSSAVVVIAVNKRGLMAVSRLQYSAPDSPLPTTTTTAYTQLRVDEITPGRLLGPPLTRAPMRRNRHGSKLPNRASFNGDVNDNMSKHGTKLNAFRFHNGNPSTSSYDFHNPGYSIVNRNTERSRVFGSFDGKDIPRIRTQAARRNQDSRRINENRRQQEQRLPQYTIPRPIGKDISSMMNVDNNNHRQDTGDWVSNLHVVRMSQSSKASINVDVKVRWSPYPKHGRYLIKWSIYELSYGVRGHVYTFNNEITLKVWCNENYVMQIEFQPSEPPYRGIISPELSFNTYGIDMDYDVIDEMLPVQPIPSHTQLETKHTPHHSNMQAEVIVAITVGTLLAVGSIVVITALVYKRCNDTSKSAASLLINGLHSGSEARVCTHAPLRPMYSLPARLPYSNTTNIQRSGSDTNINCNDPQNMAGLTYFFPTNTDANICITPGYRKGSLPTTPNSACSATSGCVGYENTYVSMPNTPAQHCVNPNVTAQYMGPHTPAPPKTPSRHTSGPSMGPGTPVHHVVVPGTPVHHIVGQGAPVYHVGCQQQEEIKFVFPDVNQEKARNELDNVS